MIFCGKCQKWKEETEFSKATRTKRNYQNWCKKCRSEYHKNKKRGRGRKCINCGNKFILSSHEYARKFCSQKCRREYRKRYSKEYNKTYHKKYLAKQNRKIKQLLGDICITCGSKERIIYHEIHGKRHSLNRKYIIDHYKDFVPLCLWCHKLVHYLSKIPNLEEIIKLVKMIRENHE